MAAQHCAVHTIHRLKLRFTIFPHAFYVVNSAACISVHKVELIIDREMLKRWTNVQMSNPIVSGQLV